MNLMDIKNINFFAKGHRGILYIGDYKGKKVIIKTKRKESKAVGRMENESKFLKILNKKKIGPRLIYYDKKQDFFVYNYVDGEFFPLFLEKQTDKNKKTILKIIKNIFIQCFRMDIMRIDKEEMHHPYKHIIIEKRKPVLVDAGKSKMLRNQKGFLAPRKVVSGISKTAKPVLIDFERAHYADKGKNVTQFCDYLISKVMVDLLSKRGIKVSMERIIDAAKRYKKKQSYMNLRRILNCVK